MLLPPLILTTAMLCVSAVRDTLIRRLTPPHTTTNW